MRVGRAKAKWAIGLALMGKPEDALAALEETLDLERSLGNPEGEAYSLWFRSEVLSILGRAQEAKATAQDALAVARRIRHREWSAAALKGLGDACITGGDLDAAEAAFRDCLDLAERMPIFQSWGLAGLASVLVARGDFSEARRCLDEALTVGTPMTQSDAHRIGAELAVVSGDPEADRIVSETLAAAEEAGDAYSAGKLRALLPRLTSPRGTGA
jgi:tetratricopeptide (TPR) repeat protein